MRINVSSKSLFSHMEMLGLASILEQDEMIVAPICVHWESPHVAIISSVGKDITLEEAAEAVRRYVINLLDYKSDIAREIIIGSTDKKEGISHSPLSPRISHSFSAIEWADYFRVRREVLDKTGGALPLFSNLVCSLGFPCYWSSLSALRSNQGKVDLCSSAWEMAPRNSGSEFMKNKFLKQLELIRLLEPDDIAKRLCGAEFDSAGEDRNACGLHAPGMEDVLVSWIALHGISCCDVRPVTSGSCRSLTSGVLRIRRRGFNKVFFVLPVPMVAVTLSRYIAAIRYEGLYRVAASQIDGIRWQNGYSTNQVQAPGHHREIDWLVKHGMGAIAYFERKRAGSDSCPEYYALEGEMLLF